MEKVYEASTALEAHMLKNMLEIEGIDSRIDGEYLQGGVGELQAIGIVRLMVDESDFKEAKGIIDQWESNQSTASIDKPKKSSSAAKGFTFGVVLTAGIAYWIFNSPVTTDGIDYNGDNILDEKWVYKNARIKEATLDRNLDGAYDYKFHYDNRGLLKSAKADNDFDGVFETKIIYRNGNAISEESDTNRNGIIDYRVNFKLGILDNVEFIDENTGKIGKRQFYQLNKLVSADYDSNGDGKLDTHYEYDIYEERK